VRQIARRWWNRIASFPGRTLFDRLARSFPQDESDGIQLVVANPSLVARASEFFTRTSEALAIASERAPDAYSALRSDIERIILDSADAPAPAYHRFQLAVIVPPAVAFEFGPLEYAAWLLRASGLSRSELESDRRADEFLSTLDRDEHVRIENWLGRTTRMDSTSQRPG
jgi:hypothetical protein